MDDTPAEFDSTLIRSGTEASTLSEISAFADMIATRPIEALLDDLSGIEFLSETKFQLASRALRRRIKDMPEAELRLLRARLETIERADPAAADRMRSLIGTLTL